LGTVDWTAIFQYDNYDPAAETRVVTFDAEGFMGADKLSAMMLPAPNTRTTIEFRVLPSGKSEWTGVFASGLPTT
jgi:hypothetical protein